MIRPFTLLTATLAIGSGYYLYQAKHRTLLLDRHIASIEQQTAVAETRISVLHAEWALENSPSRLADLAAHYLLLAPMQPNQAISMADLASRLPPVGEPGATPGAIVEPDLSLLAGLPHSALFASLDYFAPRTTELHPVSSPPAADAAAQASSPQLSANPEPAALSPPAAAPEPAPAQALLPQAVRPALVRAAQESPAPPRRQPVPVLTSALGGAYPDLPPPAPLSGSH